MRVLGWPWGGGAPWGVLGWPSGVEAGKATVFSGPRGEARVFRVQRVGKRKQGPLWEQACLGVSGESQTSP